MNAPAGSLPRLEISQSSASGEPPIRSSLIHHGDLHSLGASLARGSSAYLVGLQQFDPRTRTRESALRIREVAHVLARAQQDGESLTPAAMWLLDNSHVVEAAIVSVHRDLPARFYKQLPLLEGSDVPRVLAIAWAYVAHGDSSVSADGFRQIVQGFQEVRPLRIGELWALPSVLRFVLLENLRRLSLRVARAREMRLLANRVADALAITPTDSEEELLMPYAARARDRTFATQLLHRLRDGSLASGKALAWLERVLEEAGTDAEAITFGEHANLSAGNVTTSNIIKGLRFIDDIDWTGWFESVSRIDHVLRERTDFATLDFQSRDIYRQAIEEMAKLSAREEYEVVTEALAFSENESVDIGSVLIGPHRVVFEKSIGSSPSLAMQILRGWRKSDWLGVVLPVAVLTAALLIAVIAALSALRLGTGAIAVMTVLFTLPACEAAMGLFNTLVATFVKPTRLIGYEFKQGVPASARTLVVVPTLISNRDDIEQAVQDLEVHYLANMNGELHFAMLSDWPDSDEEQSSGDLALLDHARKQIAALNARHPKEGTARFFLLHRRRLFNEAEGCWMGWERKRGKLHELNTLLRGDSDTTFFAPADPLPSDVVYVMTVDADTRMTRDAVTKLVGKIAHPLNQPDFNAETGRVSSGYGILQPRVTPSLTSGDEASFFQRVFSANRGIDPYVFAVSDTYQDLFGEGTFTGKGLYHIDTMEAALKGRIPENTILSHDLLEGAYARAALVTDVELIEDYPTRYLVDASRHHRWVRGDWQLLPWIFSLRSGVPALSRMKMIDNLRRSLTPILWIAASVAGWTLLPFTQAVQWQALLVLSLFLAPTYSLIDAMMPRDTETKLKAHFAAVMNDFAFASALVASRMVLIAHNAWLMIDAIIRTLYRLFVSRRHLLEWRAASQVAQGSTRTVAGHYRTMFGVLFIAVAALGVPLIWGTTGVWVAFFFSLIWAGSPAFAWLVSRSAETEDRLEIKPQDVASLRDAARRTWLYFETFVTDEHNMLPPDNYQEIPHPVVAARTSPTNIGMYMLSTVSARDFGWISLNETLDRLEKTMTTLEKLERYRGHIFNWYETRTLKPLQPVYISAVDSGNLAGHLIALSSACDAWAEAPAAHLQGDFSGILDVTNILDERLASLPDDRRQLRPLRRRLAERIEGMRRAVNTIRNEPETAAIRTINLTVLAADIVRLARALHDETDSEASEELALWARKLEDVCAAHLADSHVEEQGVSRLRGRLVSLRDRARKFAFEMDFSFLLRQDRKLLSIGYRVNDNQLDEACYDLLASEARLTSLFGVAKGDLPTEHWFRLGRPVTQVGFFGALLSWSGSMFEYLMPPLVMKEPPGGLLSQSNKMSIARQISYARSQGVPWGISEAAYNARDREMTYQYTNFGVPGLGLKRGLGHDLVIAPYASLLAAQFYPAEAVSNLERLKKLGARGRFGYYDAVDFTPSRLPEGKKHAVVRNVMAHHHGMSIVAVANAVFEGRMRDRFHADPVIKAAELLLQEKAPRDIPPMPIRAEATERVKHVQTDDRPDSRSISDPLVAPRAVNLMSNGHYHVMITSMGTGYSRADEVAVTRWSGDPTEDRSGSFLFIADPQTGEWWSATAEPKRVENEVASAVLHDDKAVFLKTVGNIHSEVECIAVGEGNGEARNITLFNDGDEDRYVEITSYAELALAFEAADNAHPAFSKMFVKTEIANDGSTIFAERQRRANNEPTIAVAHFVTYGAGVSREVEAETDRRAFIGRGRSIANAAAFDPGAHLGGSAGFTLDPIMALRAKVRVPSRKKVSLTFWTISAANRQDVEQEMHRFLQPDSYQRQAMLSWTRSQVQTRHVGLSLVEAAGVQKLARYLLYPDAALHAPAETIAEGLGSQAALWPMAISGDFPIFALRIGDVADLEIVATALRMQEYLRAHGLFVDLVIVNEQASSYVQDLQQSIEQLCENARLRGHELGPRQHIFVVRRDLMDEASYRTLLAAARVMMHTRNGPILDQIERAEQAVKTVDAIIARPFAKPVQQDSALPSGDDLAFWNGLGGFANEGRDYVVRLSGGTVTPQPWINVIANREFGFHTSSEGASFTWSRNSRDFQITPWTNDAVVNRPGEAIYIHNLDNGAVFSPLSCVVRDEGIVYEARHRRGVSQFSASQNNVHAEWTQLVDPHDPVKVQRLLLRNDGKSRVRLRIYAYAEWVMGNNRSRSAFMIVPGRDEASGVLTARNPYHLDFGDRVAFLGSDAGGQSFTCDRAEFLGVGGSTVAPDVVLRGTLPSGTVEAGRDPCAVIACDVELDAGAETSLHFVLGDAASQQEATAFAQKHLRADFAARMLENERAWDDFSAALQVETPDPAFNAMVNVWLPYQSLACRLRARSAFYQASGAFGFRDQLQDTLALLLHDPSLAREQILNAAARQFPEGDVQHWWLPRTGAGVRTTITDDVVWLGYGTHLYLRTTGDQSILDENIAFIQGDVLKNGEHDSFFTPKKSSETASLYEHCARALDLAIKRTGENGLPLIMGGDWNDGMSRVGEAGKGTSVWLGWFLLRTLRDFSEIASQRADTARSTAWRVHSSRLKLALESHGWDGAWYRRGFFDDGTPLGSSQSDECRIDSIAQSWAVLSGEAEASRADMAVSKAVEMLVDDELGVVRLFTPPFENTHQDPGYIKSYPPGVRENGGQYTHAATWLVIALARLGRADEAYRVFSMLNPVNHAATVDEAERYRVEPFVIAADVYSEAERAGRGGWTWYTGSAGWMHRAAVEGILGIERHAGTLVVKPALPSAWHSVKVQLRIDNAIYRIAIIRGDEPGILLDGKAIETIPLIEGEHDLTVTVA